MKKLAILLGFIAFALFVSPVYADTSVVADWDAESSQIMVFDQTIDLINRSEVDGLVINKDVDDLFNKETQTIAAPVQAGFFDHKEFQRLWKEGEVVDLSELIESKGMEQDTESLAVQQINTKTEVSGADCNNDKSSASTGASAALVQGYDASQAGYGSGFIGYQAGTSQSATASSVNSTTTSQ